MRDAGVELTAPGLLEGGVLPYPTHAGAIGQCWAPSSCPRCPRLPVVPWAARGARTWASRSRADLEALVQVNPSNPLIPGTEIGKITRSVGKALGQS